MPQLLPITRFSDRFSLQKAMLIQNTALLVAEKELHKLGLGARPRRVA